MFEIRRYTDRNKEEWDKYVGKARNATFLFYRDYMDYHRDRFDDFSLMFYKSGRLYALLPAHVVGSVLYSHYGLTYGGLIMDYNVTIAETCHLFEELNGYLKTAGIKEVYYKPIPWIYHLHPSEEDLYAIFWKCQAKLIVREIGTAIFMQRHQRWRKDHRRRLRKALANGVQVVKDGSLADFWKILDENLGERFGVKPVHSLSEIELLKSRFPQNIIQYNAYKDGEIIGGLTIYLSRQVIHGQYSSTNRAGKEYGAMEAIYDRIMYKDYPDYPYFDFGRSTEQGGSVVNEGLIAHKEGFGGRGVCYDTYHWTI